MLRRVQRPQQHLAEAAHPVVLQDGVPCRLPHCIPHLWIHLQHMPPLRQSAMHASIALLMMRSLHCIIYLHIILQYLLPLLFLHSHAENASIACCALSQCITILFIPVIDIVKFLRIGYHLMAPKYCIFQDLHCISVIHTFEYCALRITYCELSIMCGDSLL